MACVLCFLLLPVDGGRTVDEVATVARLQLLRARDSEHAILAMTDT
jgi:hypothetical protein